MQSKGTKVVLAENFSEERFDAEGASPFLDPRRQLGPGPLRRVWPWSSGLPGLPEPWLHSSVPGPKVCFARFVTLFLSPFLSLRLKNVVLLSAGFETALDEAVKNCKALAEAAGQKEAERVAMLEAISALEAKCVAMSEAISAFCQAFGLDGVPLGSSPRVICEPWAAMCATDSVGRCTTALGGPSPCSLPTTTWIWSGLARGIAYPTKKRLP
jgi:enamine deaminase RidA (YjgF/YER057c/UK114 family)